MLVREIPERIPLNKGELLLWPQWLAAREAEHLHAELLQRVPWIRSVITIAGRQIPVPRLNAWYGDAHTTYGYSGTRLPVNPWIVSLAKLRQRLCAESQFNFNSALLNRYRDGRDSVDWHSDNEPELGRQPVIATVSLGAQRRFDLRPRWHQNGDEPSTKGRRQTRHIDLPAGSLFIMAGATQQHWQHRVPKTAAPVGERISITFRYIDDGVANPGMIGSNV